MELNSVFRSISIAGRQIRYELKRSARARRIALRITGENRLTLVLPALCPESEGLEFLEKQRGWIEKHIDKLTPKLKKYSYLGKPINLLHSFDDVAHISVKLEGDMLYIRSPFASMVKPDEIYMMFLRSKGKKYLEARCLQLAEQTGKKPVRVSIRGQVTRWGSCSRRGTISLNYKLMKLPPELIDYVIIHELCHLLHMNHSKVFWAEVHKHLPDFKKLDKTINRITA